MKKIFQSLIFAPPITSNRFFELAYALFRFYCGISIAIGAGLPKVFHKIDEKGGTEWDNLAFGASGWFLEQVGNIGFTFPSPTFWAYLAIYGEFIGGLLIAVGLFTRLSALQMAFQFFVVSFMWYESPVPFAMYYQQLIFWTFVLISAAGGGKFSLDYLIQQKQLLPLRKTTVVVTSLLLLPIFGFAQSQTPEHISFTISNPTLRKKSVDIRSFSRVDGKFRGYGYDLNALSSHAVNMPVGTRVYEKQNDVWILKLVVTADDNGRKFDMSSTYNIGSEQQQQVAADEQDESKIRLDQAAETTNTFGDAALVTFKIAGKTVLPKQVHIRVQLPDTNQKTSIGFSRKLDRSSKVEVSYPVGSKVYLCEGPYWKGDFEETLVLTLDAEKQNYLIRL
ncbi:MAG: DoxX family protein [Saprospiraceae bacterium]|nr:DoxX family protein [Saprospiraceae bacterium]